VAAWKAPGSRGLSRCWLNSAIPGLLVRRPGFRPVRVGRAVWSL
jgi:hypothetical protein